MSRTAEIEFTWHPDALDQPWYSASVAVRGDRIGMAAIGRSESPADAVEWALHYAACDARDCPGYRFCASLP